MRHKLTQYIPFAGICLALTGTLFAYARYADDATPALVAPTLDAGGMVTLRTRTIFSSDAAYVLGRPETIADISSLEQLVPSPDSGAVLIAVSKSRPYRGVAFSPSEVSARLPEQLPEIDLIYWDVRARTARTLLREPITPESILNFEEIKWFPGTRVALMVLDRYPGGASSPATVGEPHSLIRVDAVAGITRNVFNLKEDVVVSMSPTMPIAYIRDDFIKGMQGKLDSPTTLQVYTPAGLGRTITLEAGTGPLRWMADGKTVYSTKVYSSDPEGKRTSHNRLTVTRLDTGEITHPEKLPPVEKPPVLPAGEDPASPFARWDVGAVTANTSVVGPSGQKQDATALWLQAKSAHATVERSPQPAIPIAPASPNTFPSTDSILVATNAKLEGYLVNRNTMAVLFTRDGALCAAPVFRLKRTAYEQGMRSAQREATTTNAKQVGLAILMYTQDYDENFPQPGTGLPKAITPYLKDDSVFNNPATGANGFFYTWTGSTLLANMTNPSTTQLGYLLGPGGRAIIWVDGHVTWQDDPPTPTPN